MKRSFACVLFFSSKQSNKLLIQLKIVLLRCLWVYLEAVQIKLQVATTYFEFWIHMEEAMLSTNETLTSVLVWCNQKDRSQFNYWRQLQSQPIKLLGVEAMVKIAEIVNNRTVGAQMFVLVQLYHQRLEIKLRHLLCWQQELLQCWAGAVIFS